MTSAVNSEVVADPEQAMMRRKTSDTKKKRLPFMSAVLTLPALMTSNVEDAMLFASWSRLATNNSYICRIGCDSDRLSPKMTKHHCSAEDHRCGVGLVGAHNVAGNVTASRLKESIVLSEVIVRTSHFGKRISYAADVATRDDARAAD